MTRRLLPFLILPLLSCGGGNPSPVGPTASPTPTGPTGSVQVTVFYDENRNGQLDGSEVVRIPNVNVTVGSASAKTQSGTGVALVQGVPHGTQNVAVETASLPPYWVVSGPATVSVPAQGEARIAATLPVNEAIYANQYVAFGDSLTRGEGSSSGKGYPPMLESQLRGALGAAWVVTRAVDATYSTDSTKRIHRAVKDHRPTHVLLLYGTNDWNSPECQLRPASDCYTIDELRATIEIIRGDGALTILSTLPPVSINTGRNQWIEQMNVLIKALGHEQGVAVVDAYAAIRSAGSLSSLYFDDVHLNDAGYQALARVFATGLTTGRNTGSSMSVGDDPSFGFLEPAR